jgi:hypothetical protein
MKVLSLWQPWATLMAIGAKKIETRSWSTPFRGRLAIHAAKHEDRNIRAMTATPPYCDALKIAGYHKWSELPLGAIVAVVTVVDCRSTDELFGTLSSWEHCFGDYGPGRYGWITDDLLMLPKPMPFAGGQGLTKEVNDGLLAHAMASCV